MKVVFYRTEEGQAYNVRLDRSNYVLIADELEYASNNIPHISVLNTDTFNASIALDLLRSKRTEKLKETDHLALTDQTLTTEMATYRQALRDLPSNSTPTLNSDGSLDDSSFTWPIKP